MVLNLMVLPHPILMVEFLDTYKHISKNQLLLIEKVLLGGYDLTDLSIRKFLIQNTTFFKTI
jgi:hypothetical protein